MQFSEDQTQGYLIQSYTPGRLVVNGISYHSSVIINPDACTEWPVIHYEEVTLDALQPAVSTSTEVVIIGTGEQQHFPSAEHYLAMSRSGMGIEIMDSAAAARTYNVLVAENRKVVAAIIV